METVRVKITVKISYMHNPVELVMTIEKPKDLFLSLANGYQLLFRCVENIQHFDLVLGETDWPELPEDIKKLKLVTVLDIKRKYPAENKPTRLFTVGNLTEADLLY